MGWLLAGGVPVRVQLRADADYAYRPDDIAAAITPRTTTIFLNTPHNPTGAVLSRDVKRFHAVLGLQRVVPMRVKQVVEELHV